MNLYTPEEITELKENEIFVFGSNESGIHGGGAAKIAFERFGAKWGQGYGLQGQTFAIPTKNRNIYTLSASSVKKYVYSFIQFVIDNPQYRFYLTKIGCGLAGFEVKEIKEIIWQVLKMHGMSKTPENLIIPKGFNN